MFAHDDVIKWKRFTRYWPFAWGIHRSSVNSPHKGQWRGALIFSLIWAWISGWVNNREAGDLRRYRAHYDVTVKGYTILLWTTLWIQVPLPHFERHLVKSSQLFITNCLKKGCLFKGANASVYLTYILQKSFNNSLKLNFHTKFINSDHHIYVKSQCIIWHGLVNYRV